MVFIAQGEKTECLDHLGAGAVRSQHLRHAPHRAGLRLESDLYKIALLQRLGESQNPAGDGDGLKSGLGSPAILKHDYRRHRSPQLSTRSATLGIHLWEVSHKHLTLSHRQHPGGDY